MENNSYNTNNTTDKVCCNTTMNNGMNHNGMNNNCATAYHSCRCCMKTWFMAMLAAFVVMMAFDWLYFGNLIKPMFDQTSTLWRSQAEMQNMWPFCFGMHIVASAAFACIAGWVCNICDGQCAMKKGLKIGMKTGLLMGAAAFGLYVMLPISFDFGLALAAGAFIKLVLAGAVVGMIYKMKQAKKNTVHIETR